MTPYVQREVFRAFEQVVWKRAAKAVSFLESHWGNELRCHELTRAVHRLLDIGTLSVVDGKLGAVEHSWLVLVVPIAQAEEAHYLPQIAVEQLDRGSDNRWYRKVIIDVYTPGRLPQVQLIDPFVMLKHGYEERVPRSDINEKIVDQAYTEMRDGWQQMAVGR